MNNTRLVRSYKIISVIILAMCVYFFLLPLISPLMEKLFPGLWTCPFLRITGHECPFCGITGGLGDLYNFDIGSASVVSMVAFLLVLLEAAFRILLILFLSSLSRRAVESLIFIDVIYHLIMVIGVSMYVIMYLLTNF
ncbi:MAG: DUF2752 domain-containing protein [Clostridia bacterium]|nr:DUF2752 domain-containing protein [Clostridia bacterium]MBN2882711.1 DUF2752 domain-containing protein [Clostridia bacterium]